MRDVLMRLPVRRGSAAAPRPAQPLLVAQGPAALKGRPATGPPLRTCARAPAEPAAEARAEAVPVGGGSPPPAPRSPPPPVPRSSPPTRPPTGMRPPPQLWPAAPAPAAPKGDASTHWVPPDTCPLTLTQLPPASAPLSPPRRPPSPDSAQRVGPAGWQARLPPRGDPPPPPGGAGGAGPHTVGIARI